MLLHKFLGELRNPLLKKHKVLASKRIGADLFEIAATEIEEVSVHEKNSKHLQKLLEQKQFENSLELERRNPSVS